VDRISSNMQQNAADTERAWIAVLVMPALFALAVFVAFRAHIVMPINAAIRRLTTIGTPEFDQRPVARPWIHDLKLISEAVETYGEISDQLRRSNALLQVLSDQDALTKVGNRRKFDEALAEALSQSAADAAPVSLLLVDLDHFKLVNDTFGHQTGDLCLSVVADILRHVVTVNGATIARYGGEEFGIVLAGDASAAMSIAEAARLSVETAQIREGGDGADIHLTVSIGCATAIRTDAAQLIASADAALYRAKNEGRNRVRQAASKDKPLTLRQGARG